MNDKLTILWTNADPITAKFMVFMYAGNALKQKWWKDVEIIVWGATAKLVGEDKSIQEMITDLGKTGVKVRACKACAQELGVEQVLVDLGIEVDYMGVALTDALKGEGKVLSI